MSTEQNGSPSVSHLPLFWIGAGIGFFLSGIAVIAVMELFHNVPRRKPNEFMQDEEVLIYDSLHSGVGDYSTGTYSAGHADSHYSRTTRERIRYGLDPSGASPSSSHVWYTGEDDPDAR